MKKTDLAGLHRLAMDRFDRAWTFDEDNRNEAEGDLEFLTGEGQWQDSDKRAREQAGQPCLTINRMPQFVRQVTGDIRKANPAAKVGPGDGEASKEIADVYQGIIRDIEQACDASSVYENAAQSAAACGVGAFRILTEYATPETFDQVLKVKWIPNPFAVYWDPLARDPSRRDAKFCFVCDWISKKDFEAKYPGKNATSFGGRNEGGRWFNGDNVRIAEYWWIEEEDRTLYLLASGEIATEKPEGVEVQAERKAPITRIKMAKMSAHEVIEEPKTWVGTMIPIVAVVGEEIHDGENIVRTSVIRYAKDAQRLYNYGRSAHAELVSMQPKAPYLVTAKQVEGLETLWNQANVKNRPYLPYNVDPQAGAPKRETPPIPSQGLMQEVSLAAEDMKATTGIYDAGLGAQSNETSGVAIRQRQEEGDVATSIYVDNLAKSIAQCGRIMVDMIPKIYDGQRMVSIVGEDEVQDLVEINALDPETGQIVNDLSVGRYNVRIAMGPSYTTRRQEAAEQLIAFAQAVPAVAEVASDLIARTQDWPGADEIADRLAKVLPNGVADTEEDLTEEEMMAQAQAQEEQQRKQAQLEQFDLRKIAADVMTAEAGAMEAQARAQKAVAEARKTPARMDAETAEKAAKAEKADAEADLAAMEVATGRQNAGQPVQ